MGRKLSCVIICGLFWSSFKPEFKVDSTINVFAGDDNAEFTFIGRSLKNWISLDVGYGASLKDWIEYEAKLL